MIMKNDFEQTDLHSDKAAHRGWVSSSTLPASGVQARTQMTCYIGLCFLHTVIYFIKIIEPQCLTFLNLPELQASGVSDCRVLSTGACSLSNMVLRLHLTMTSDPVFQ